MIEVFARTDPKRDAFFFSMEGHAGFCPGNDIVCAGASALAYALLGYVEQAQPVHLVTQTVQPGDLHLVFQGGEAAKGAFSLVLTGLLQLQNTYPDHVHITQKEGT